jgi:hypothetical protein
MTTRQISRVGVWLCLAVAIPAAAFGQQSTAVGGPLTGPPVVEAPFSADATTIVQQTLANGTRIERRATARYYRDRAGRVRVEQMILGLDALNPAAERQVRITVYPDPSNGWAYTLDPVARTASRGPRDIFGEAVGGGDTFSVPLGGARFLVFHHGEPLRRRYGLGGNAVEDESLGSRPIEGVQATGRRITITVPVGQLGNDRPMQIVDERWESPELKHLLIYSRTSDPRTGVVEYRLTNIRRTEPPPDLFVVPSDYTVGSQGQGIWLEFAEPTKDGKRAPSGRGGK